MDLPISRGPLGFHDRERGRGRIQLLPGLCVLGPREGFMQDEVRWYQGSVSVPR